MTEQEEFEFRLRLENEQSGLVKAEEVPPELTMIGDQETPPTMSQYLLNRAQMGLSNIPAVLGGASAIYGSTFDPSGSEFPTRLPPQGTGQQAMDEVRRGLGINPNLRPATELQRGLGAFTEAAVDPLNLFGLGGVKTGLGLVQKGLLSSEGARVGLQTTAAGLSGVGGEYGGEYGQKVGGLTGQIIGGVTSALLLGGGSLKAGQVLFDKAQARFNPKDFDIADMAEVEGASRAKDLVERALEADPNLQQRLQSIQDRVFFVTGKKGVAAVTGLDNLALRSKLKDIAENDVQFATEIQQLYADLKQAVNKKSIELYPAPNTEIPSAKAKITEQDIDYDKRIGFINNQLDKITSNFDITGAAKPTEIGTSIQNLVLSKEKAARKALSPEYDSVLGQASNQGALLPAQDTQALLNTAFDLFQQDPWGRNSGLLKLVDQQSAKFKAMRRLTLPEGGQGLLPTTTEPDLSMGMDITSLDSLKKRVASDIRTMQDTNIKAKLIVLQQKVDEALDKVQNASGDIQVDFRGEKMPFGQAMTNLDTDYFNKVGIPFKDAEAIKKINSTEYISVVVTNQSAIARNLVTEAGLRIIHNKLESLLGNEHAKLDAIYYCPHHPHGGYEGENVALKIDCDCRKPKSGMLLNASKDFNIDLKKSWMIGDTERDILAGKNVGCTTIGVDTGMGVRHTHTKPDYVFADVLEAVNFIVDESLLPIFNQVYERFQQHQSDKPFVINIGGNTRSGKSTLATYLQKKFVHQLFRPINYARMFKGKFSLYYSELKFSLGDKNYNSINHGFEENECLKKLYQHKIDQNYEMKEFLVNTYLKPIVSYDNHTISKKICCVLSELRQHYMLSL